MKGVIVAWKPEKGFGFIRPEGGGSDVFVHIRDFGNISRAPKVGDAVRFQLIEAADGRSKAADVLVDGLPRIPPSRPAPHSVRKQSPAKRVFAPSVGALALILVAGFVYSRFNMNGARLHESPMAETPPRLERTGFECAGKRRCFEMTSCNEATYYLTHCPNTEIDGDHDGVPCEDDLCE